MKSPRKTSSGRLAEVSAACGTYPRLLQRVTTVSNQKLGKMNYDFSKLAAPELQKENDAPPFLCDLPTRVTSKGRVLKAPF